MDIPHQRLVYFQVTAESGSLRRAAARLNIAPSAVSRQIALLEQAFDAPLLERTPRGVRPTLVGEMVLDYCRQRSTLDGDFVARLEAHQRLETGTIMLVVGEGFIGDLIDTPLKTFTERYRDIRLDVRLAGTDDIIEAVVEDQAHIGLMFHERIHPQLRFWHSSAQPLMAICPPGHPLTEIPTPLTLEQLAEAPAALWKPGHGVRTLVDQAFAEAALRPWVSLETNSMAVLRHSVLAGMNITFLPRFAVAHELEAGSVVARSIACETFRTSQAHMITRVGRRQPQASLKLLRHLGSWMRAFRGYSS
ncbi:LysR family transcriptional regulator [Kushneria phosphatilytica]|uniref:LysR family transcriptional regulator n=1 Tax=Kushneria phosphatilytica TaxID=657387 RepID=A0A1S1NTC0_9GAMM|nr:LysR family transcriptional regulator [Kushneria phosphatilytica]OHV08711.1 LysR family transcriptional regulator [Kushneria phosphatilytica]QEL12432.1 LysR family transcriptional regulator [Kushneria phosphatilytica]